MGLVLVAWEFAIGPCWCRMVPWRNVHNARLSIPAGRESAGTGTGTGLRRMRTLFPDGFQEAFRECHGPCVLLISPVEKPITSLLCDFPSEAGPAVAGLSSYSGMSTISPSGRTPVRRENRPPMAKHPHHEPRFSQSRRPSAAKTTLAAKHPRHEPRFPDHPAFPASKSPPMAKHPHHEYPCLPIRDAFHRCRAVHRT